MRMASRRDTVGVEGVDSLIVMDSRKKGRNGVRGVLKIPVGVGEGKSGRGPEG
jgi:hypothetical protein